MFGNSNLGNWLGGSARDREYRQTRDAWDAAERAWDASPLGGADLSRIALDIGLEVQAKASRRVAVPILVALCEATDRVLWHEDITPLEANWPLVENDVAVAVNVRKMLVRRLRWARDYDRMMSIVRRQLVAGYLDFVEALPESCFESWNSDDEPTFAVPLFALLDRPAEVIQNLVMALYDDETLKCELFMQVREQFITNALVASGFPPTTNPDAVATRIVMPTAAKGKNAAELIDSYLVGTPFAGVFELPIPFHVPDAVRFEHCHIVGGTGHGKTQLMQRMIHADLVKAKEDGRSVVVIDSQGDLINKLVRLDLFSPDRDDSLADRLVIIDPADVAFPAALNLFDAHLDRVREYSLVDQERVLNGVVELYETFFGALLGAELTQKQGVIFRYLARLMLNIPGATVHTLMQLMENGNAFRPQMETLNGSARYFFETEFFHPSFAATKKQILKRLWGVLSTPAFERMFAQTENRLDLFEALNEGKIILINTAKDLLKTEGSQLFGRFFIAMLAQAALERSTIPEWRRTPTFVYVDEAQEYFDDTIETILGQARKYRLGIIAAHQTLDQLSPRLRAAFLSNTSFKCVGGVSAKDARALASELHTSTDFIESTRRRGERTEFAVWLKNRTHEALRLSVPLGFLERQRTLTEDEYDALIDRNRALYCGTLESVPKLGSVLPARLQAPNPAHNPIVPEVDPRPTAEIVPATLTAPTDYASDRSPPFQPAIGVATAKEDRTSEAGKGGPKHRYLQSLVKELAEQHGFRAQIEAPLAGGAGQVDVLLERDGVQIAIEVSVSTPAEYERHNVRKCLEAGYSRVALVLTKSRSSQARYRSTITESLSHEQQERLSFLVPEDLPDYIASLAPPPETTETLVRGYKVRTSHAAVSPEEARSRRETLAKLVARSLNTQSE